MAQYSVLVVEDEEDILEIVAYSLERAGLRALKARNGSQAWEMILREKPDLVVLDLMLPQVDGKEICRRIRQNQATRDIPVIMLTALAEEVDRVVGFELGADDYVTKPFSPRELVLRVQAILRRTKEPPAGKQVLRFPDLIIDPDGFKVEVKGKEVPLTVTEFKLLYFLASNVGKVQDRETLLDRVWGYSYEGYARTVDTHIRRLRHKLGELQDRIETIRGLGYRFKG